jgi:hypothetical protein
MRSLLSTMGLATPLASNNLVINNSFKGSALTGGAPPNWIVGPTVNGASIATNTHPGVNFDMN